MQKSTRFPLHFRIWLIASGAVFAVSAGLLVFFDRTDYGFLYSDALRWVCFISFIVLFTGLTVWLCRCVFKRKVIHALVSVACVLLALAWSFGWLFGIVTIVHAGEITSTRAGRISGNRYYVHTSPGGTNQFVIIITVHGGDMYYAYPMLNRWIYKEDDQRPVLVWDWPEYTEEYTVEWPSEQQAVVTVIWLPDEPDGFDRIIVNFNIDITHRRTTPWHT